MRARVDNSDDQGFNQEVNDGDNSRRSAGEPYVLRAHYSVFSLFFVIPFVICRSR
jgi:hypothetical protein